MNLKFNSILYIINDQLESSFGGCFGNSIAILQQLKFRSDYYAAARADCCNVRLTL